MTMNMKKMRNILVRIAKELFRMVGMEVRNRRTVYVDHLQDLARIFDLVPEPVILDVGANRGDTVAEFRKVFPGAQIHAFEPTPKLSVELAERFQSDAKTRVIAQAVSDQIGTTILHIMSNSVMNSILPFTVADSQYYGITQQQRVEVPTITITDYCNEFHIEIVHILKLDIQGSEKFALSGARPLLEKGRIEAIYFEIHFFPLYMGQSSFGELEIFLRSAGYRLYGFYEMNRESNGCLDYCNALYLSSQVYDRLNKNYLY